MNIHDLYEKPEYKPGNTRGFNENPYIEALPEPVTTAEQVVKILGCKDGFTDDERRLSNNERLMHLNKLSNYFMPLEWHFNTAMALDSLIRRSYLYNNPLDYVEINQKLYKLSQGEMKSLESYDVPPSYTVIGVPGVGKSSSIKKMLAPYNKVYRHTNYKGILLERAQSPVLIVQCPASGTRREFSHAIFKALGEKLMIKEIEEIDVNTKLPDELQDKIAELLLYYGVSLIVLDEIENVLKSKESRETISEYLTTLTNKIGASICYLGTPQASALFTQTFHLTSRMCNYGMVNLEGFKYGSPEWKAFSTRLWDLYQITRKKVEYTPALDLVFFQKTMGIPRECKSLFLLAQKAAIANNSEDYDEEITPEFLEWVAEENKRVTSEMFKTIRQDGFSALSGIRDLSPIRFSIEDFTSVLDPKTTTDKAAELTDLVLKKVGEAGILHLVEDDFITEIIKASVSNMSILEDVEKTAENIFAIIQNQAKAEYEKEKNAASPKA